MLKNTISILILLLFAVGCKKPSTVECDQLDFSSQTLNVYGTELKVQHWEVIESADLLQPQESTPHAKVQSVLSDLSGISVSSFGKVFDGEIVNIVLYFDCSFVGSPVEVKAQTLSGFIVFTQKDGVLISHVYERHQNGFGEIKEFNLKPRSITSNAYYAFADLIFSDPKGASLVSIFSENQRVNENPNGVSLEGVIKQSSGPSLRIPGCQYPCLPATNGLTCESLFGSWRCRVSNDCAANEAREIIDSSSYSFDLDFDELYSFRNDFLLQNSKGLEYVAYYDTISHHLTSFLTLQNSLDGVIFMNDEIVPIIKIMSDTSNHAAIVYDADSKNNIVNELNSLKTLLNNLKCDTILDQIIFDVSQNVNKSADDIRRYFR